MSFSVFDHFAADQSLQDKNNKVALAVAQKRVDDNFGLYLKHAGNEVEFNERFGLAESEIRQAVHAACDEYGGQHETVYNVIIASLKEADDKWIEKAVPKKNKGLLHKKLDVPEDEKIPEDKLEDALDSDDEKLREEAQFAENVKKGAPEPAEEELYDGDFGKDEPTLDDILEDAPSAVVEVPADAEPAVAIAALAKLANPTRQHMQEPPRAGFEQQATIKTAIDWNNHPQVTGWNEDSLGYDNPYFQSAMDQANEKNVSHNTYFDQAGDQTAKAQDSWRSGQPRQDPLYPQWQQWHEGQQAQLQDPYAQGWKQLEGENENPSFFDELRTPGWHQAAGSNSDGDSVVKHETIPSRGKSDNNADLGKGYPEIDKRRWSPETITPQEPPEGTDLSNGRYRTEKQDITQPAKYEGDAFVDAPPEHTDRPTLEKQDLNSYMNVETEKNTSEPDGSQWTGTEGQHAPVTNQAMSSFLDQSSIDQAISAFQE